MSMPKLTEEQRDIIGNHLAELLANNNTNTVEQEPAKLEAFANLEELSVIPKKLPPKEDVMKVTRPEVAQVLQQMRVQSPTMVQRANPQVKQNVFNSNDSYSAQAEQRRTASVNNTKTQVQANNPITDTQIYDSDKGMIIDTKSVVCPIRFTEEFRPVDTSQEYYEQGNNFASNIHELKQKITEVIYAKIGSFARIQNIKVRSEQLYINNAQIKLVDKHSLTPEQYKHYVAYVQRVFPFDICAMILEHRIAPLADWYQLMSRKSVPKLHVVEFDSSDFVDTYIYDSIGLASDSIYKAYFYTNIQKIIVGGKVIAKEPVPTTEMQALRKNLRTIKETSAYNYRKLLPTNITGGISKFFGNSFKTYIKSRGNKGFIRYIAGSGLRLAAMLAFGALDLGTNLATDSLRLIRLNLDEEYKGVLEARAREQRNTPKIETTSDKVGIEDKEEKKEKKTKAKEKDSEDTAEE